MSLILASHSVPESFVELNCRISPRYRDQPHRQAFTNHNQEQLHTIRTPRLRKLLTGFFLSAAYSFVWAGSSDEK